MRRGSAWLCLVVVFGLAAGWAQGQSSQPEAPVVALDHGLTNLLATGSNVPFAKRYAQFAPVIDEAFDLQAILQSVVGLRWATIPTDQQQGLLGSFRRYTVANYVANFSAGGGTVIKLAPGSQAVGEAQMISTSIVPATGDSNKINYLVKQGRRGWQINDIYLDGTISQVAVQRSDFRSLLASGKGVQPLVQHLDAKVTELSGGAVKP